MGQIVLCLRVTATIQLIDPLTLQLREVDGNHYWGKPFFPIAECKRLVKVTKFVNNVNENLKYIF